MDAGEEIVVRAGTRVLDRYQRRISRLTEGVNTRTKAIKRQMYGRAGFELLRHRIPLS